MLDREIIIVIPLLEEVSANIQFQCVKLMLNNSAYFNFRKCKLKAKNDIDNVMPTDANDVIV